MPPRASRAALVCWLLAGCASTPAAPLSALAETEIRAVLAAQEAAWNRGDLEAFMEGYEKSAGLTFAAGGNVTRGWKETLDRYRQGYSDREKMGRLRFQDLEFYPHGAESAVVLGRWLLEGPKRSGGLFTLLFRKTSAGWRIVLDHTSSAL